MTTQQSKERTIAVIGGGVSGALTAYHLVRQHVDARVVVIDSRPELGLGLAYSTPSLRHLLNVPAGKISAIPAQPAHFLHWLRAHFDSSATADTFAPRAVFGRYVHALVQQARGIEQVHGTVADLRRDGDGALLTLSNGQTLQADAVVLALGNFDPAALPGIASEAIDSGLYVHNAWAADAYDGLPADAPVVLIGTGLTGVDVLLRLRELGHRGTVTAVSRHGVLPRRHAPYAAMDHAAIPAGTEPTCVAYLRAFHAALRGGAAWRAAIDSLRATGNDLWQALPLVEQKRFRRHLQRRWDVVRHRMAPSIADGIDAELAAGTLLLREGHLAGVTVEGNEAVVSLRTPEGMQKMRAARVINCTGPAMNYRRVDSPLLQSLLRQGLVTPGPLGGGFNTTHCGAVIDADGRASAMLFNLGPGRLGTCIESIAVPEIREQAFEIAGILAERMGTVQDVPVAVAA